jgi:hypothetical protein
MREIRSDGHPIASFGVAYEGRHQRRALSVNTRICEDPLQAHPALETHPFPRLMRVIQD